MANLTAYTAIHTALSLIALIAGIGATGALLGLPVHRVWTTLFLAAAVATSVTGFGFPFARILPSHVVGAVALVVLALVIVARRAFGLAGAWRRIYAAGIVASLYFLVFVLIAQAFLKVAALRSLAPTQSEPPFAIAQLAALALFVVLGVAATRAFARGDARG